jgi:hypothetical protein
MRPSPRQTPSPPGAKVYFINLNDGAELDSPFSGAVRPFWHWHRPSCSVCLPFGRVTMARVYEVRPASV